MTWDDVLAEFLALPKAEQIRTLCLARNALVVLQQLNNWRAPWAASTIVALQRGLT